MVYARREFRESLQKKKRSQVQQRQRELTQLAQAEVPIEVMTRSSEWDYFLSLLQNELDQLDQLLALLQESYAREPSFSYEAMAERKAQMMQVSVQRDTLRHVMELPKEIMEKGAQAKLVLHDYSDARDA